MKANSRYLVINPGQDKAQVPVSKSKTQNTVQEYTDGFYSSSTDNENDELKMIQEEFRTVDKEVVNSNMIGDKSESSLGIDFGSTQY